MVYPIILGTLLVLYNCRGTRARIAQIKLLFTHLLPEISTAIEWSYSSSHCIFQTYYDSTQMVYYITIFHYYSSHAYRSDTLFLLKCLQYETSLQKSYFEVYSVYFDEIEQNYELSLIDLISLEFVLPAYCWEMIVDQNFYSKLLGEPKS